MAHLEIEAAGAAFESLLYSSPHLIDYQHLSTSRKHFHSRQSHCSEATDDSSDDSDLDELLFDSLDAEHEACIRILDPRDWKQQDHYKVLGLSKLRYHANPSQIKHAYKRLVLHHHPDKRKAKGLPVGDDTSDYFTCIIKAFETLSNVEKKRAYDSADPTIDDTVPTVKDRNRERFFEVFGPLFESNSRWSRIEPVPELGDADADEEEVEAFYKFWREFESWREYSYLDEEDKERAENREERRYIDRQNKADRTQRKKAEMARIMKLVENAYACDPRVARIKEIEKQRRLEEKQARAAAARKRAEEELQRKQALEEQERAVREAEAEKLRKEAEEQKSQKEQLRKQLKTERKKFRTFAKDSNYFLASSEPSAKERADRLAELDRLSEGLSIDRLVALNSELEQQISDAQKAAEVFLRYLREMVEAQEAERAAAVARAEAAAAAERAAAAKAKRVEEFEWSYEQTSALVKALEFYKAGCTQRWTNIAEYVNSKTHTTSITAQMALAKAKALLHKDTALKEEVGGQSLLHLEQRVQELKLLENVESSVRYPDDEKTAATATSTATPRKAGAVADSAASREVASSAAAPSASSSGARAQQQPSAGTPAASATSAPLQPPPAQSAGWTANEQRLLEEALRRFPTSDSDRWTHVAAHVGSRSKQECIQRCKELAQLVKTKKGAPESTSSSK